jgi:hypothetical protein
MLNYLEIFVSEIFLQPRGVHPVGQGPLLQLLPGVGRPAQRGQDHLQVGVVEVLKINIQVSVRLIVQGHLISLELSNVCPWQAFPA